MKGISNELRHGKRKHLNMHNSISHISWASSAQRAAGNITASSLRGGSGLSFKHGKCFRTEGRQRGLCKEQGRQADPLVRSSVLAEYCNFLVEPYF